ncbi:MAG: hypothetical protein MAG794_00003 [Gammaproteobacteria bacterium]|nr:hypothetical protein [Gammaproteobacteria bacterium]
MPKGTKQNKTMNLIHLRKVAVGCALALSGAPLPAAEQGAGAPPGVYAHTTESETYLQKVSQTSDAPKGQAGLADNDETTNLDVIPSLTTNDRTPTPGISENLLGCGILPGSSVPLSDQPLQSDFARFDRQMLDG